MTKSCARIVCAAVVAFFAVPEAALAQCPMCRQALLSPEAQTLAAALRSGILFLLAAPFVVFGTVAAIAARGARRRRQSSTGGAPE